MAIDDNTTYGLTGAQIKELPVKIDAAKGKAKELTSADYNWPENNPTELALWLLDSGVYTVSGTYPDFAFRYNYGQKEVYSNGGILIVSNETDSTGTTVLTIGCSYAYAQPVIKYYSTHITTGGTLTGVTRNALSVQEIMDALTSSSTTNPLSANQGRVLNNKIEGRVIQNAGAPTTATVGTVGMILEDTTNGKLYICTAVTPGTDPDPTTYTWEGLGGGPAVVQTTGTSTTDVMSQNATTSMVYGDSQGRSVRIGTSAYTTSNENVAIGWSASTVWAGTAVGQGTVANQYWSVALGHKASATAQGAIALGASSRATVQGEMNIGTTYTDRGYNNSNYRLLTGLYDGQSAHDAATVGQITPATDSSAPTSSTAGRLGEVRIDTTDNSAYMCVVSDDVTPSYTWKKITA